MCPGRSEIQRTRITGTAPAIRRKTGWDFIAATPRMNGVSNSIIKEIQMQTSKPDVQGARKPEFGNPLKILLHRVPRPVKTAAKNAFLHVADVFERSRRKRLFGDQVRFVPPLYLINDGPRDYTSFKQNGIEYFDIFVNRCGLKKTDRILDIGCGVGRKTIPLLDYVNPPTGAYEGIDVYAPHVAWCKKKIQAEYPHFRFQHADVWSKLYNPSGAIQAKQFDFPFPGGSFDFIIMGSVFTHLFTEDMEHYIDQIGRVLKPGARGMVSFFLLNPESEALILAGKSSMNLIYNAGDGCKADNAERFESAVGHREETVLKLFLKHGIRTTVFHGSWCGRGKFLSFQDVIRLDK
jgi:SAM-dependent methyltransferase